MILKQVGTVAVLAAIVSPTLALAGHGHCNQRAVYVQKFVAAVPVYYAVGAGLREEAIATRAAEQAVAKALADNDAKWEQKVNQLFGSLRAGLISGKGTFTFQAGTDDNPQPNPQPTPVDPVPPNVNDGPEFTQAFQQIVATKCAACHGADKPQKAIDPANTDATRASLIFLRTFSADPKLQMPPNGDLTDEQRQAIFLWASEANKKKGE